MYKPYENPFYRDLKKEWHQWHMNQKWIQPIFTSVITNCHTLPNFSEKPNIKISKSDGYLNKLDMKVGKDILGRKYFHDCNTQKRHNGLLFREHVSSNLHYHGIIDIKEFDFKLYENTMKRNWFKILPSGSIKVRPVDNLYIDVRYVLKEQTGPILSQDNCFFEFPSGSRKYSHQIS